MSERFRTHYQRYSCGPNSPTTTTYSAHNCSCPNSCSASDTPVSAVCQPSFPSAVHPIQTADEAKTPFSSRLFRQMEFRASLPQLLVRDVRSGSRVTRNGAELLQNERDLTTKSGGTTLASARALCLDRLSRVWLRISGGLNCCQESRRGVV